MADCKTSTNNTKQAAWVAIGSLFSFGFSIVSSMILSRYFEKGDYGTYKQVLYVYDSLLAVFTLGLPRAFSYFLPRVEIRMAKDLINKITYLFFALGALFSISLFLFSNQISIFLNNPDLAYALRIFSVVPFLMLPTMGLEGILSTYKMNKFMTLYVVCTRLAMLLCVVLPVILLKVNYIGAIIGFVCSSVFAFILALILKYKPVKNAGNDKCNITYREIFQFSIPLLLASLWSIIINSADSFFVSRYFGKEIFAEFANGWIDLPFVGMISGACATVLSPIFSRLSYQKVAPKEEIYPIWMSVFNKSALIIYPILMYCCFFADVITSFLFGEKYAVSGFYFILKNINCFFSIIAFGPLLINIGNVKLYSNVHMFGAICLLPLEYIVVSTTHSVYLLLATSVACTLCRILFLLYHVAKYFKVSLWQIFPIKTLITILPITAVILFGLKHIITHFFSNSIIILSIAFVCYVILLGIYSTIMKLDYLSIIKPLFKK